MGQVARKIDDFDDEEVDTELVFEAPSIKTLRGDIRDELLREFKGTEKPWAKMNEKEQERLIHRANDIALAMIRGTIDAVASRGFNHCFGQVDEKITVSKGIELKITLPYSDDAMSMLAHCRGQTVILITRDHYEFLGEARKAEPDVVGDLALPKEGEAPSPEAPADPETSAEHIDPDTGEVTLQPPAPETIEQPKAPAQA